VGEADGVTVADGEAVLGAAELGVVADAAWTSAETVDSELGSVGAGVAWVSVAIFNSELAAAAGA
jgi:hypothetical protein